MVREEEIQHSARDYVSGVTLSSPSNVIHFDASVKWMDKNPNLANHWHDANEEPLLEGKEIIFLNKLNFAYSSERFGDILTQMFEELSWEKIVELLRLSKWAYINDLLLKGGRK